MQVYMRVLHARAQLNKRFCNLCGTGFARIKWRKTLRQTYLPYDRCHYHVPPGHTRVTVESGHTSNGYWKRAYSRPRQLPLIRTILVRWTLALALDSTVPVVSRKMSLLGDGDPCTSTACKIPLRSRKGRPLPCDFRAQSF